MPVCASAFGRKEELLGKVLPGILTSTDACIKPTRVPNPDTRILAQISAMISDLFVTREEHLPEPLMSNINAPNAHDALCSTAIAVEVGNRLITNGGP